MISIRLGLAKRESVTTNTTAKFSVIFYITVKISFQIDTHLAYAFLSPTTTRDQSGRVGRVEPYVRMSVFLKRLPHRFSLKDQNTQTLPVAGRKPSTSQVMKQRRFLQ